MVTQKLKLTLDKAHCLRNYALQKLQVLVQYACRSEIIFPERLRLGDYAFDAVLDLHYAGGSNSQSLQRVSIHARERDIASKSTYLHGFRPGRSACQSLPALG